LPRGLTGVSFGHFLIKQVAEEIARENARLSRFVTLSPAPNFADGSRANGQPNLQGDLAGGPRRARPSRQPELVADREDPRRGRGALAARAAWYFLRARGRNGVPADPSPASISATGHGSAVELARRRVGQGNRAILRPVVNYLYESTTSRRITKPTRGSAR